MTTCRHPDEAAWERHRAELTELYVEQGRTLRYISNFMRNKRDFKAPSNVYKRHFQQWGLWRNISGEEVIAILENHEAAERAGTACVHFLKGTPVDIEYVRSRDARNQRDITRAANRDRNNQEKPLFVVSFTDPPSQPGLLSAIGIDRFKDLFRETHNLLHSAFAFKLCEPWIAGLQWHSSDVYTQINTEFFKLTVSQGIKYHSVNDAWAAGRCWRDASFRLENLCTSSDLDVWSTFIRCCGELQRHGLSEVAKKLLEQVEGFLPLLKAESRHIAFLKALVALKPEMLKEGSLLFSFFKLKTIEKLWPSAKRVHFPYRLDVAEARLTADYSESEAELPTLDEVDLVFKGHVSKEAQIQAYRMSICMCKGDYTHAEAIAAQCVKDWECRTSDRSDQVEMATFYIMLATLQIRQRKLLKARESLHKALNLQQGAIATSHGVIPLCFAELHDVLHRLEWLSSSTETTRHDSDGGVNTSKANVEYDWEIELQRWAVQKQVLKQRVAEGRPRKRNSPREMPSSRSNDNANNLRKPSFHQHLAPIKQEDSSTPGVEKSKITTLTPIPVPAPTRMQSSKLGPKPRPPPPDAWY